MVLPRIFHLMVNIENDDAGMITEANGEVAQRQRRLMRGSYTHPVPFPKVEKTHCWCTD